MAVAQQFIRATDFGERQNLATLIELCVPGGPAILDVRRAVAAQRRDHVHLSYGAFGGLLTNGIIRGADETVVQLR